MLRCATTTYRLTNARIDIVVGMLLYIYALMHLKARDELRSPDDGERVHHLRTSHGSMFKLNSNTQHIPLSVAIELEHAPVARSHMVVAFCENERFSTLSVGFDRNASATSQDLRGLYASLYEVAGAYSIQRPGMTV